MTFLAKGMSKVAFSSKSTVSVIHESSLHRIEYGEKHCCRHRWPKDHATLSRRARRPLLITSRIISLALFTVVDLRLTSTLPSAIFSHRVDKSEYRGATPKLLVQEEFHFLCVLVIRLIPVEE